MALEDLSLLCSKVKATPHGLCVVMPGGQEICVQLPSVHVNAMEVTRQLIAQINAALAPYAQIFTIADALIAVFKCVQKIPDLIPHSIDTFPTPADVAEVAACFSGLIEKINEIIRQLPPFTIPAMILDIADVLISFLEGLKDELQAIIDANIRVINAQARADALGNFQLKLAIDCASESLAVQLADLNESITPMNRFFAVLKFFSDLTGGAIPGVPTIPELGSDVTQLASSLTQLDTTIGAMKFFRDQVQKVKDTIGSPPTL